MAEKRVLKLSSRGRRFGAAMIDLAIPFIITIIMCVIAGVISASSYYYYNSYGNYGAAVGGGVALIICIIALIAYIVVEIVFYAKSQSIGKAILGMQVVSSKNGKPVGIWWMLFREFLVKPAGGSQLALGYIWILIDKKNRGWADKILDTYVVDSKPVNQTTVKVKVVEPVEPVVEQVVEKVAEPVVETVAPCEEKLVELVETAEAPAEAVAEAVETVEAAEVTE